MAHNDARIAETLHCIHVAEAHPHNPFVEIQAHGDHLNSEPSRNRSHGLGRRHLHPRPSVADEALSGADEVRDAWRIEGAEKICHTAASSGTEYRHLRIRYKLSV